MNKVTSINTKLQDNQDIADLDDTEKLVQVRELLFGEQAREHSYRAEGLQSQLEKQIAEMSGDLNAKLQKMNEKIDEQSTRIDQESAEREDAVSGLQAQSSSGNSLISDLSSRHEASQAQLLDRCNTLEKQGIERHEEQMSLMEQKTESERVRIAEVLRKIADELSHKKN